MNKLLFALLVSSLLVALAFGQKGTSTAVKDCSVYVNMGGYVFDWNRTADWDYFQMDTVDTYAFPIVGRGRNDSTYRVYFSFALGERKGELWEYTWNASYNNFTAFNAGSITDLGASGDISMDYGRNDTTLRIYVAKGASGIIEEYTWNAANNNYTISQLPNLGGHFYMGPWVGRGRNDSTYRVYIGLPNGTAYELTWNGAGWAVFNMGSIEDFAVRGVSGGYGRNDSTVRVYFGGSGSNSGIYEFSWNQTNSNYTISKILDKPNRAMRPPEIGYGRNDATHRLYGCAKDTGEVWELTWNGTGWNELYVGSHGTGARRVRIADGRNDETNRLYVGDRPAIYELTWNTSLGNFSFTGNITTEAGIKWIWVGPGRNDSRNRIYVNNEESGACWLREYSYLAHEMIQGDMVLTGNNVTILEGRFEINGSIIVEENATLILRNALVNFTQVEDYQFNMTFRNAANGNPRLLVENALIASNKYSFSILFFGNSSASINELIGLKIELQTYDDSTIHIFNSTTDTILSNQNSKLWLVNSTSNTYSINHQSEVYVCWHLDVHVADSVDQDVPSANVTATYPNATVAGFQLTDATGWTRLALIEKKMNSTGEYPIGNYTVETTYESYSEDTSVNMTGNRQMSLILEGFVIPECPSSLILPLFMMTTLLAVIVYRRKCLKVSSK